MNEFLPIEEFVQYHENDFTERERILVAKFWECLDDVEHKAAKTEQLQDQNEILNNMIDWMNGDIGAFIATLIEDVIEAKGVKYKIRDAFNYFNRCCENDISNDAAEMFADVLEKINKVQP